MFNCDDLTLRDIANMLAASRRQLAGMIENLEMMKPLAGDEGRKKVDQALNDCTCAADRLASIYNAIAPTAFAKKEDQGG